MKALLLKDIRVLSINMKFYFILILLYTFMGAFVDNMGIFQLYPILLFSLFPITALSYDERCHWNQYGITMPISRRDLVLSKYILGIAGALLISVFTLAVNLLFRYGNTDPGTLSCFILAVMSASMISLDLILPISLCFGTEKGRLFYLGTVILLPRHTGRRFQCRHGASQRHRRHIIFRPDHGRLRLCPFVAAADRLFHNRQHPDIRQKRTGVNSLTQS